MPRCFSNRLLPPTTIHHLIIARLLKKLEATRNTGLEKTGRVVLSAGRLETQLGIMSVASDGILRFVGVIKILEREPKPLPSQNLLMCVDNCLDNPLNYLVVGRVGVGSREGGHGHVVFVGRETHRVGAVRGGLRLEKKLHDQPFDVRDRFYAVLPCLDKFRVQRGVESLE